jgi:hypothetical protein
VEVDGEVVEAEEEEEGESGRREVQKMNSPAKPSAEEVEHHNLTHLPFRNWCRHCIRGRGKEASHKVVQGEGGEVPEVHLDYCFPGEEETGKNLTVLVARMRNTRMTMSTVIPSKTTGEFTGERIMAFIPPGMRM